MTGAKPLLLVLRAGHPPVNMIVVALVVSVVEIGATLWFPIIIRDLIDSLSGRGVSTAMLWDPRVQLLLAVLLAGALASAASGYLLARAGQKMVATLRLRLVEGLLGQPVPYFDQHQSGEHVSRIIKDADVVAGLVTADLQHLVSGVLLLIGSGIVLSLLDLRLAFVIFAVVLAAFLLMAPVMISMSRITLAINDRMAALAAMLARTFGEIRLVKAFGAERLEGVRAAEEIDDLFRHNVRAARVQASLQPLVSLALSFVMLAIFAYGGARVALGTLSVGTLTAFVLYIFNVVAPLIQLSMFFSHLSAANGASLRLAQILAAEGEIDAARSGRRRSGPVLERRSGLDLEFEDVRLVYPGSDRPALRIDRLLIPAEASVAIIGPSGAGKTTIFSLIECFYAPTEGRISWGGIDIRALPLDQWRSLLGYVPQSAPLMAGSVRDNIAYGSQFDVDDAAIEAAARAANCLEFIAAMPDGFDSQVGEAGNFLSGGQRQRIALARMFIRDPRILLMDEATANLDEESEALVLGAMRHLMSGRMTLVITHRLSTAADADFIAVLEEGKLEAFGPAGEIMANSAYYLRLKSGAEAVVALPG